MKTIRSGIRRAGGVSFFAFQDVIMSVTGVVIVIALLLALQIDKVFVPTEPAGLSTDDDSTLVSAESLQDLEVQMAELRVELDRLRGTSASTAGKNEVEAEIAKLEQLVALRLRKSKDLKVGSISDDESDEMTKKIAEVARLKYEIKRTGEELRELAPEVGGRNEELQRLENQVKDLEGALLAAMAKPKELRLIPERAKSTKQPIIVVVSRDEITAQLFDSNAEHKCDTVYQFTNYCSRFKPSEYYFVFFFRPSGTGRFGPLRQSAINAGFEVGYDAIEENTLLRLGK